GAPRRPRHHRGRHPRTGTPHSPRRHPLVKPTRRTVLLAGTAAALTPALPAAAAAAAAAPRAAADAAPPYASYWYPDSLPAGSPGAGITWRSLKSWSADTDADLAFNASTVPLAARVTPTPVNSTARAGQA